MCHNEKKEDVKLSSLILGVDSGSFKAKIVGEHGVDTFKTNICDWFVRDVEEKFGTDDMEFEIDGRKGYAGTIAEYEDDFDGGGSMFGDTKNHDDNKIRVILAIFRYIEKYAANTKSVRIVTGQPIKMHNETEKDGIIKMLEGEHDVTVNGKNRTIIIEEVKVSPEGSGAFWSNPKSVTDRAYHILDIGSGTINAATVINKKFITTKSNTFNFGMETIKNKDDLKGAARGIIRSITGLKWKKDAEVMVCGGVATEILPHIQEHFANASALLPKLDGEAVLTPVYANATGFYEIAKKVFK